MSRRTNKRSLDSNENGDQTLKKRKTENTIGGQILKPDDSANETNYLVWCRVSYVNQHTYWPAIVLNPIEWEDNGDIQPTNSMQQLVWLIGGAQGYMKRVSNAQSSTLTFDICHMLVQKS